MESGRPPSRTNARLATDIRTLTRSIVIITRKLALLPPNLLDLTHVFLSMACHLFPHTFSFQL